MRAFADLLERLLFTPSRNAKLRLMQRYFAEVPDPDRGWALAALSDGIELPAISASRIKDLASARTDPVLFALSRDYVGDLAETVALIWPAPEGAPRSTAPEGASRSTTPKGAGTDETPRLSEVVETLRATSRARMGEVFEGLLDRMGPSERLALIKLATGGGTRVGVSARLAKTALAAYATSRREGAPPSDHAPAPGADAAVPGDDVPTIERIEELWHGLAPPYEELFAWVEGGPEPSVDLSLAFRPMMLANPVEERWSSLDPAAYRAEWKWDGIRVQAAAFGAERRLYSRTGEDIAAAFPDIVATMAWEGAVDGELLVARDGEVAPFSELQRRLGRKEPGARLLAEAPAHLRLYDILHDGAADTRALPLDRRRAVLADWLARHAPERTDLSPLIPFETWADLEALREGAREASQEGLMLKRGDSPYQGGRPMGPWFKWKREPLSADCVLIYAQRGSGKRSSFYSDYTFAAWAASDDGSNTGRLVPVGKAYSGYTDEELKVLDRWIRNNTVERFGPVRSVDPRLVLEIAFDAVQRSTRHKSGIAMRFPRIKRIRWDKPAEEADRLESLEAMIPPDPTAPAEG
ncbi:MAG: cisplatin damage response ATP-dependent DNA ligase [Paracoccaceae bacterium]